MVTADLLSRARAGDGEAFRELTGPHRRELQVHCYRMLGSFADAEDAVQETMLAAWQGIGGFVEERASLRTWLYKIATNRCLNARRAASRRPARVRCDPPRCRGPRLGGCAPRPLGHAAAPAPTRLRPRPRRAPHRLAPAPRPWRLPPPPPRTPPRPAVGRRVTSPPSPLPWSPF